MGLFRTFSRVSLAGVLAMVGMAAASVGACSSSGDGSSGGPGSSGDPAPAATTPAPGATPAPTNPPTGTGTPPAMAPVTSIRVHYTTAAPLTSALTLRGSGASLTWDKDAAFTSSSAGVYTWSSAGVTADLEVKPLLGDAWSRGPNYRVKAGQAIDIYPHFTLQKGTYAKTYPSFVSQKLPSTRGVWVYLPAAYLENTATRLPVMYMHDAQNLFDPALAFGGNEWKVDETLDAGAEDGSIREVIVVGVENTADRINELTQVPDPTEGAGGKADQYLSMITDEIKPMIDKDLRTVPVREQTAIVGSSLGGLVSAYAGVQRADVFGLVGALSPSTWWDNEILFSEVDSMTSKPSKPVRVYVDSGDSGTDNDDVTNTTELAAHYRSVGYVDNTSLLHLVQSGGQHNEVYWAQRLPGALHFLLGARPDSAL